MYLGIEIGGTKLQIGLGRGDGTLAALWRGAVDVAAGPEGIRRQITAAVPELLSRAALDRANVQGVGIGFGGPVDDASRMVIKSHQIEGWDHFALAEWVGRMLGFPAVLGNDADVAGLAEALYGAGKGLSPVFYITVGSGIGGGLVINGDIYRGSGRGAAEVGHLRVAVESATGRCHLPLEEVASGWAIGKRATAELGTAAGRKSVLHSMSQPPKPVTAEQVGLAANQGDEFAWSLLRRAWGCLAEAICHVIALVCPRKIVIGGGVSLLGERLLFEPLRELVAARVFKPFADCYEIVPAAFGEEVVIHGALALARRRLSE
jgi:glucokinase